MKSFDTQVGGSWSHGKPVEAPKPTEQEPEARIDARLRITTPEEVKAFRAKLRAAQDEARQNLGRAEVGYRARQTPAEALQNKIQRGEVLYDGTPEAQYAKELRRKIGEQRSVQSTQTESRGLFQRFRNLFR